MMDCNKLMNSHEKQFLRLILNILSEELDIDIQEMNNVFNLKHKDPINYLLQNKDYDIKRCKVLVGKNKQCSRKHNHSGFCLTHYKMYDEKQLDPKNIINFQKKEGYMKHILTKLKEKKEQSILMNTNLFIYDEKEYLINKYSGDIYDFHTYEKIGKLDKFNQIKFLI